MKLLIIDDEHNIRELMKKYVLKLNLNFDCIETATNGNEGLQKAKKLKPDVVISDIIIPNFTGLELLDKIKSFLPVCKYIVISGHDDVEYFKTSIKLDVVDYLLKPIKPLELKKALEKCINLIEKERQQVKITQQLKKYINDNASIVKQHYFKSMLSSSEISIFMIQQMKLINFELCDANNFILANLYIKSNKEDDNQGSIFELISTQISINKFMDNIIEECQIKFHMMWNEADNAIICFYCQNHLINKGEVLSIFEKLTDELSNADTQFFICISDGFTKLAEMNLNYCKLEKASKYLLLSGYNNIIFSSDTYSFEFTEHNFDEDFNNLLIKYGIDQKEEKRKISVLNVDRVKTNIIIDILIHLSNYCRENDININIDYNSFIQLDTIDDIYSFYKNKWLEVEKLQSQRNITRKEYITEKIKEFVKKNYRSNIGVSTIAANIQISPNYCGTVFAQQTNEKISDYINRIRLDKACELLKNTDNNINVISRDIGYDSSSYFVKLFKKYTGYTPSEYKENVIRTDNNQ